MKMRHSVLHNAHICQCTEIQGQVLNLCVYDMCIYVHVLVWMCVHIHLPVCMQGLSCHGAHMEVRVQPLFLSLFCLCFPPSLRQAVSLWRESMMG